MSLTLPDVGMTERDPSTLWRGLRGPFTCTECGTHIIYTNDAAQTVDGIRKLCDRCNRARLDAHWADQPDGLYAVNFSDHTGKVLATGYVRKGPTRCGRCGTEVESMHGIWWTKGGDDFTCPDGETQHTLATPAAA